MGTTTTDDSWSKRLGTFATKHETAKGKQGTTYHLTCEIDDPTATYEDHAFGDLADEAKKKGIYQLPLASGNRPFEVHDRPEDAHPVVIAFLPLCFRHPQDRKDAMNYAFVQPGAWIYIWVGEKLWDEVFVIDAGGGVPQYVHVNLTRYQGLDTRPPTTVPQPRLFVPHTTAGGTARNVEIAVSHVQWSWAQIAHYGRLAPDDPRCTSKNAGGAATADRGKRDKRLQVIPFKDYQARVGAPGAQPFSTPRASPGRHLLSIDVAAAQLIEGAGGHDVAKSMWPVLQGSGKGLLAVVLDDPIQVAVTLKAEHAHALDTLHDLQAHMSIGEYGLASLVESIVEAEGTPAARAKALREELTRKRDAAVAKARVARAEVDWRRRHSGDGSDPDATKRFYEAFKSWQDADAEAKKAEDALDEAPEALTPLKDRIDSEKIKEVIEGWHAEEEKADKEVQVAAARIVPWLEGKGATIPFEAAMSDFFEANLDVREVAGISLWLSMVSELGTEASELEYFRKLTADTHLVGGALRGARALIGDLFFQLAFHGKAEARQGGKEQVDLTDGFPWLFDESIQWPLARGTPLAAVAATSHGAAMMLKEGIEALAKGRLAGEATTSLFDRVVKCINDRTRITGLEVEHTLTSVESFFLRKKYKGFTREAQIKRWPAGQVPRIAFKKSTARIEALVPTILASGRAVLWLTAAFETINIGAAIAQIAKSNEPGIETAKLVSLLLGNLGVIGSLVREASQIGGKLEAALREEASLENLAASLSKRAFKKQRGPGRLARVRLLERRLRTRYVILVGVKVLGILAAFADFAFAGLTVWRSLKSGSAGEMVAAGMELMAAVVGIAGVIGGEAIAGLLGVSATGVGVGIAAIGVVLVVGAALVRLWYGEADMEKALRLGYFGKVGYQGDGPKKRAVNEKLNVVDLSKEIGAILELLFDFVVETTVQGMEAFTVHVKLANFIDGESELQVSAYPAEPGLFSTSRGAEMSPLVPGREAVQDGRMSVTYTYATGTARVYEIDARLRVEGEAFVPTEKPKTLTVSFFRVDELSFMA